MTVIKSNSKVGLAGVAAAAVIILAAGSASATEGDASSSNTVAAKTVTSTTAATAASTTGGIIGGAVGSAVGGATGGVIAGSPSTLGVASLGISGGLEKAPDGRIVGKYFNSRDIAGRSAGSKNPRLGVWVQGAYTSVDNDEAGGRFDGNIFNVIAGIDYKPKVMKDKGVVGVAVGWEDVDVTLDFNNGTLEATGFTVAPYVGIAINKFLSFDASAGYTAVSYDQTRNNNAVIGEFDADRAFAAMNLTGNFKKKNFRINPKVGILGLWEGQDAYTDSTGAANGRISVHLGRALFGGEVGFRIKNFEPFVGVIGNWDFNDNNPSILANGQLASDEEFSGTFSAGVNFNKKNITGQIKGQTNQFKNEISTYTISGRVRVAF